jgi:hypothetical protein
MLQQWSGANQRTPPLNRRQSGATAYGRCTVLRESSLRRLGTQILKPAAILGFMLVRLLVMAFYLELSLLKSLNRPRANQRRRRNEIVSRSKNPVFTVPLLSE